MLLNKFFLVAAISAIMASFYFGYSYRDGRCDADEMALEVSRLRAERDVLEQTIADSAEEISRLTSLEIELSSRLNNRTIETREVIRDVVREIPVVVTEVVQRCNPDEPVGDEFSSVFNRAANRNQGN